MKKMILIAVAITTIGAASAQDDNTNRRNEHFIEVRGVAKAEVVPNKAEISILLNQADDKGKTSIEELENQLSRALKAAGIDTDTQLKLVDQTSAAHKRRSAFQYKRFILTVNSSVEAQNVFAAFDEYRVKNADITRIWYDKEAEVNMELKVKAIKNAKESAQILVEAIGQTIGKAIMIADQSYGNDIVRYSRSAATLMDTMGTGSELPDVEFQQITVERTITVRFLLP